MSFPALEGLVDLANRDDIDISPTLLRVLTDLYLSKPTHSSEEERQYTELALRLLDVVDVSARQNVALKLAAYAQAPTEVVRRLANDVVVVADPILRRSRCLTDDELIGIACANEHAQPGGPASRSDPFAGSDAAGSELNEVFFAANAAERRLILLNLHYAPLVAAKPVMPHLAIDAVRRLEAAALGHNAETFVRELARALAVSQEQARRLASDPSGEPIVIAARALAMPAVVLQRILLCLNPVIGHSVQRVYDLADLYDQLKPEAALRMLGIWRSIDRKPRTPSHHPHYYDDESRRRQESRHADARPVPAVATRSGDRRFPNSGLQDPRAGARRNWR